MSVEKNRFSSKVVFKYFIIFLILGVATFALLSGERSNRNKSIGSLEINSKDQILPSELLQIKDDITLSSDLLFETDGITKGRDLYITYIHDGDLRYMDLRTIWTHDGIANFKIINNFKGDKLFEMKQKYNVSSAVTDREADCKKRLMRSTNMVGYTGEMGSGLIADGSTKIHSWEEVLIDSNGEKEFNIACYFNMVKV